MPKIFVVQVNVTDMDIAMDFYCNKLGFKATGESYYPEIVQLSHYDGDRIPLILCRVEKVNQLEYGGTQTLLAIQTDNLADTMDQLSAKGVEFIHRKPQSFPSGIFAAALDPFGNALEFCEVIPTARREQMGA